MMILPSTREIPSLQMPVLAARLANRRILCPHEPVTRERNGPKTASESSNRCGAVLTSYSIDRKKMKRSRIGTHRRSLAGMEFMSKLSEKIRIVYHHPLDLQSLPTM